jgi:hypothetical protein
MSMIRRRWWVAALLAVPFFAVAVRSQTAPSVPPVAPPAGGAAVKPPEAAKPDPSVDDLLRDIEAVRAQKAKLDKQEQELTRKLREKMARMNQRMQKLGLDRPSDVPVINAMATPPTSFNVPVTPDGVLPPVSAVAPPAQLFPAPPPSINQS